ncbi:MAG: hypothetical protein AAF558_10735 [Verrucomicrobiota bacterium]
MWNLFLNVLLTTYALWGIDTEFKRPLKVCGIFADNMVLQQGVHQSIWGECDPAALVSVKYLNIRVKTRADQDGKWRVIMPPLDYHSKGSILTVATKENTILFDNVLVGEVWLCSGQSNMEWTLQMIAESKDVNRKDPIQKVLVERIKLDMLSQDFLIRYAKIKVITSADSENCTMSS